MIGDALSSTPPVASGAPTQPVVVKEVKKHAEAPAKEPAADIPDDADTAKEEQQIEPKATVKEAVAEVHAPAAQAEPEAKVEVAEKPSAPVKSGGIVWGGKQTIADLFKDGDSKATAAAPVFTTKPSKPQQPARQAAAGPDNSSNEQKATSLYVKGSLEGCDQQQLRKVFQPFGYIQSVNVKSGYAFVDYDSFESVTKALEHHRKTPLKFNDKVLEVEQRSNSKSSNRNFNSNNAGGRGGYRSRGGRGGPRRDRKDKVDGRQRGDRNPRDGDGNRRVRRHNDSSGHQ